MIVINDWLWEGLYTIKTLYDHGKAGNLLDSYGSVTLDGDYFSEIASVAIGDIFERTHTTWRERDDMEVMVFFDPVIDEFYRLCHVYEETKRLSKAQNPHPLLCGDLPSD